MMKVDPKRCPQNHRCPAMKVCPSGAINQNGFELPQIDQDTCTQCMTCVKYCPMGAINDG
jgi:ferredoxin